MRVLRCGSVPCNDVSEGRRCSEYNEPKYRVYIFPLFHATMDVSEGRKYSDYNGANDTVYVLI
jgi:hypothetical protein